MSASKERIRLPGSALDQMADQAVGDPVKLAALSSIALSYGQQERAYKLAKDARELAPHRADVQSRTQLALTAGVPKWHFRILQDDARNSMYDKALRAAIQPGVRVLDIGAGSGLLAMMAARAGAEAVTSCEMNPAVADAAREIVRLNDLADIVKVVGKASYDLETGQDLAEPVDVLVQEIVANDLLSEGVLAAVEDAARRLLKPRAVMIPSSGAAMVALAHWTGLPAKRLGTICGFDLSPFNSLARLPHLVNVDDPQLSLSSEPAVLFDFNFSSGGPFAPRRTTVEVESNLLANGLVQWIRLQLDAETVYENTPGADIPSCWAARFTPFDDDHYCSPGERVRINGSHNMDRLWIWVGG